MNAIIVDDDQAVLFLHELVLKQSGVTKRITKFAQANDALEYLRQQGADQGPCVIFLDINMPEMDGWDFLELLEASDPEVEVYVVMVTSSIQQSDRDKAKQFSHVVHYIEKPLNFARIAELQQVQPVSHLFQVSKT